MVKSLSKKSYVDNITHIGSGSVEGNSEKLSINRLFFATCYISIESYKGLHPFKSRGMYVALYYTLH